MFFASEDTLIIVHQDETLVDQIKKLLKEYTITVRSQHKNESFNVEFWSEQTWIVNKKSNYISNKVLFLGKIKEASKLTQVIDVDFDKFGVKYGYCENRAIIWTDSNVLAKGNMYDSFLNELNALPVLDSLKTEIDSNVHTGKLATAVALDLFLTLGISSSVLLAKNKIDNQKAVNQQMLAYGIINFFGNSLDAFMREQVTKNIDIDKRKITKLKNQTCCPVCRNGKMMLNKINKQWYCDSCFCKLPIELSHILWFCEKCSAFLNTQENFNPKALKHICQDCGCENNTTFDTAKSICSNCGKILADPHRTICANCKQIRREETKKTFITGGILTAELVGVALGEAIVTAEKELNQTSWDFDDYDDDDDDDQNLTMGKYYTSSWLKSASDDELKTKKAEIQSNIDWSGSILDGNYDTEIKALDTIDEELNERSWNRYNSEDHSNTSYGVHREHGWYLPNDD